MDEQEEPRQRQLSPEQERKALEFKAQVTRQTLEGSARQQHGPAAQASHLAALAIERPTAELARVGVTLTPELEATIATLREAQRLGATDRRTLHFGLVSRLTGPALRQRSWCWASAQKGTTTIAGRSP